MNETTRSWPGLLEGAHFFWAVTVLWTVIIGSSLAWNIHSTRKQTSELALAQARSSLDKDILYRSWNLRHGGVYVPVTGESPPNPNLSNASEQNITTPSGRTLTLVNPGSMARQAYETGRLQGVVPARIVSIQPINTDSAAAPWEKDQLEGFGTGKKEGVSFQWVGDRQYVNIIRPLVVERSCLKCHEQHGYKEGEIRGGISLSVPMRPFRAAADETISRLTLGHSALWIIGLVGIAFAGRQIKRRSEACARAEQSMLRSESRFRETADGLPLIMITLDGKGTLTFCNDHLLQLTGWKRREVIGQNWFEKFLSEDVRGAVETLYFQRCLAGRIPSRYENEILTRSGDRRTVAWNCTVIRDQSGNIVGATGIGEDITDRRNAEKDREHLEVLLRHSQKMESIGTLAGGIAHDFNNILSAIIGYSDLAKLELPKDSPLRYHMEQIDRSGYRARDLVKQILAFSRQGEHEKRPVKMEPIVKETVKLLRASIPSTIDIRTVLDARCDSVLADATQMHQVLMNLCTNAWQAMRQTGGVLSVGLREVSSPEGDGPCLELEVTDTGCGIPPELVGNIFEPYFTTKTRGEGTGLGLAVVQGIVQAHGGVVRVRSAPGKGTTFQVYLPMLQSPPTEDSRVKTHMVRGAGHILYVDDEPALVEIGKAVLERLGYRVTTRVSSLEALEAFRAAPHRFDLVITDYAMPRLSGLDLARKLKGTRPELPILMTTGFSEEVSPERMKRCGIGEVILKPIITSALASAVQRLLNKESAPGNGEDVPA